MEELADKVWRSPEFHTAANQLQRAWIAHEIHVPTQSKLDITAVGRVVRAAAILACSSNPLYREKAYRAATSAYELFGATELPLEQAARVVLGRLGNFPAMLTREAIAQALPSLPLSLIAEEVAVADERTVAVGERSIVLTNFQHKLWTKLRAGRRLALAAPTSAGKSFVLQSFLASLFGSPEPRSVVYLVPTRALIAQVSHDLRGFLKGSADAPVQVEIATVPVEAGVPLPSRVIYVMTQERFQLMLQAHRTLGADIVIVDEAHSIGDGSRGILLQWVVEDLLARSPAAQLLFASPGVRNLDLFGRSFGLNDIELLPSREPTVAQNFLAVSIEDPKSGTATIRYVERGMAPAPIAELDFQRRTVNRIEKLVNVAERLGKGASNIVYANGAADAESIAMELAARFEERPSTPRRDALSALAAEAVHKSYALVDCVKRGVAYHYSNMPTQVRQAVESAVANGDIDYLVCTSTLLQGVNLPAKNVFMFRPEKGQSRPLESVDFWNLAGRAGRLLKEFQGNIFLIDYDGWAKKPLDQDREAHVVSAIEHSVTVQRRELISMIQRDAGNNDNLEASFVRLLDDYAGGALPQLLDRICSEHGISPQDVEPLVEALALASEKISLPREVLRRSANISAHKQQELYRRLYERAKTSRAAAIALVPPHPRDAGAYEAYAGILEMCHRVILGLKPTSRYHRFLALMALWWMRGYPLPRIVQNQLNRNRDKDRRLVVRNTLELVEREVRYQCVRLFGCYGSVLAQVLEDLQMPEVLARMPSVPLFLEIGASDRTMISLMAIGISRVTATKLTAVAPSRALDVAATIQWLRTANLSQAELSPLLLEEVADTVASLTNVIPLR